MKAEVINPFVRAAANALETMAFVKPEKQEVKAKDPGERIEGDVSGTIGLSGSVKGAVTIVLPEKLACTVVSGMLGEEITTLGTDVEDGIGEIANMIAGGAKKELVELGYSCDISLPTVVTGTAHVVSGLSSMPRIAVKFSLNDQFFWVEVSLKMD